MADCIGYPNGSSSQFPSMGNGFGWYHRMGWLVGIDYHRRDRIDSPSHNPDSVVIQSVITFKYNGKQ
jgi:hypothetical protein